MTSNDGNEAMRLLHSGNPAQALPLLEAAHQASPDNRRYLHGLAKALLAGGRKDEAIALYESAAERLPGDAGIFASWAGILLTNGDRAGATALLQRSLANDPLRHDAGAMMGALLRKAGEIDAACAFLQPIVAAHPGYANLAWEYGQALMTAERLPEAQAQFERLLQLQPQHAHAQVALAKVALSRGATTRAIELLRDALAVEPDNVHAWWELVHAQDGELNEEELPRLLQLAQAEAEPWRQSILHDALVWHFDRNGKHPQAAGHALRSNSLRARLLPQSDQYDATSHAAYCDSAIQDFDAPLFTQLRGSGSLDRRPIFVIGLPRSGTTLLEQMLAAHPQIAGVGEQQLARSALQQALAESVTSGQLLTPAAVDHAARWHLGALAERLARLGGSRSAMRVVDKLPDNYLLAGWLALAFPQAAIIHVLRDPRDVALSAWLMQFSDMPWSFDLEQIVGRIQQHRRLMQHWRSTIGGHLTEIRYEELVADPERQLRRALAAIGVNWDPAVLKFSEQGNVVRSASQQQVRKPLNTRGIGRWKQYEAALQPVLSRLERIADQDELEVPQAETKAP